MSAAMDANHVALELISASGLFRAEQVMALHAWWVAERKDSDEGLADLLARRGIMPASLPRTVDCVAKGYLKPEDPASLLAPVRLDLLPPEVLGSDAPFAASSGSPSVGPSGGPSGGPSAAAGPAAPLPAGPVHRPARKIRKEGALDALRSLAQRLNQRPTGSNDPKDQ